MPSSVEDISDFEKIRLGEWILLYWFNCDNLRDYLIPYNEWDYSDVLDLPNDIPVEWIQNFAESNECYCGKACE